MNVTGTGRAPAGAAADVSAAAAPRSWLPIVILALAQFIMVLDSTVMNVSLTTVVKDLDTTVARLQLAITLYTLVMGALMLVGGKLGDIMGRRRAFVVGLLVYGLGSFTTSISPNVTVLIIGWSFVEALGAILVIPAVAALAAGNYRGHDRAIAFSIIGGMAGAAAAAGPLIGGLATTYLSWRVVFAGEVVAILLIIPFVRAVKAEPRAPTRERLDVLGGFLSATGIALIVLGILKSSEWGLIAPKGAMTIAGHEITPFGLSVVPFLIIGGGVLLGLFFAWIRRMEARGREPLLKPGLLRVQPLASGLMMISIQYLAVAGTFFVLPVYLQLTLQRDALQTGIVLLPLAAGVVVFSLAGGRLGLRYPPRRLVQGGLLLMLAGAVTVMGTISPTLKTFGFGAGLALLGAGVGVVLSQLGNINLSSVDASRSSEVGGAQGVFQNVGSALGTALIGAILITGLTTGFQNRVAQDPAIPADVSKYIAEHTKAGVQVVSEPQVAAYCEKAGLPPDQVDAVASTYSEAQLLALKEAMLGVGVLVVAGFFFTRKLPRRPIGSGDEADEAVQPPPGESPEPG